MLFVVLSLVLIVAQDTFAAKTLPEKYIKCKRSDPNLSECVRKAEEDALKYLRREGAPSLDFPKLVPVKLSDFKLSAGSPNSPVSLTMDFKNMVMTVDGDTVLSDLKIDLDKKTIRSVSTTPVIVFTTEYDADGKLMVVPIKGKGSANFTLYDLEAVCELSFKEEVKDGETYWMIQKFEPKFKTKKLVMFFSGLVGKDQKLNDGMNKFMNENWEILFEALGPEFESIFGKLFKSITNKFFGQIPINQIFVD